MKQPSSEPLSEFEKAGRRAEASVIGEFVAFLGDNKRWWMTPIVIVFAMLAGLAVLSSTAAAPFIYSLF